MSLPRFSLRTLLLVCTIVAVTSAIGQQYPAFGVLIAGVAMLGLPAMSKANWDSRLQRFLFFALYLPILTILIVNSICIIIDDLRLLDVSL